MHKQFLAFTLLAFVPVLVGQSASQGEADGLFQKQDWAAAAAAYRRLVAAEPQNGAAWFRLGASLHRLGDEPEAGRAFERAVDLRFQTGQSMVNVARARAHAGDPTGAAEWLNRAADANFLNLAFLDADPDFARIRSDESYRKARARIELNGRPCQADGRLREFDFWLGEWDVLVSGQTIATSRIESVLDGCLVQENWMPFNGRQGKSWNYRNSATGKWEQLWMSGGVVLKLEGSLVGGKMVLEGRSQNPGRASTLDRITFSPLTDGRVSQVWEQSTDGGQSWSKAFDGVYVRRNP
ncbi:MAG: tetratricopeptide repeat protein [Paludibaculum sp.]